MAQHGELALGERSEIGPAGQAGLSEAKTWLAPHLRAHRPPRPQGVCIGQRRRVARHATPIRRHCVSWTMHRRRSTAQAA